jgi:hypothetical protein
MLPRDETIYGPLDSYPYTPKLPPCSPRLCCLDTLYPTLGEQESTMRLALMNEQIALGLLSLVRSCSIGMPCDVTFC